jgi:hypothetical protein
MRHVICIDGYGRGYGPTLARASRALRMRHPATPGTLVAPAGLALRFGPGVVAATRPAIAVATIAAAAQGDLRAASCT